MCTTVPVEKNKDYELNIDNIGINGEGIGRIEGFTVFVDHALVGERVNVKIVKIAKNYCYGKLLRVIQVSPDRISPNCSHFHRCGGCQLQHLSYTAQLDYKTQRVRDALTRIGGVENVIIHPALGMDDPWRYRNKAQFPVGLVKDQLTLGFYVSRSHNLVDIEQCPIQHSINDKVTAIVRKFIKTYNILPYDEKSHNGIIRHVVTKVGFKSRQLMVVIITNGSELPHIKELVFTLREGIPGIISIVQNIQSSRTNVVMGEENLTLWGQDSILDSIGDLKFKISPLSFFQVNPQQTEVLYRKVLEYAQLSGNDKVIDAYSGIGTISLFLAQKSSKVYGVEVIPQAIEDARENAQLNEISNVEFILGEAETEIPRMAKLGLVANVIVVDPPRKGCNTSLLDAITEMAPDRIVYVSCNPATLARDLKYIDEKGYKVKEAQPVDMFPHTIHVECVVKIEKK